jgi:hypothetical protein
MKRIYLSNISIIKISVLLGTTGVIASIFGLFKAGIGWDSAYNTSASIATRNISDGVDLAQAYEIVPSISEFYGVLIYDFADRLNNFIFNSSELMSPASPETYLWQGAVNISFAVLAVTGLSYAIYKITNSVLIATSSWALLNTLPVWVGMSHVNFKDMPIAAGLTLISSGLMLKYANKINTTNRAISLSFITLGTFLAVGTRAGSIILIVSLILGSEVVNFLIKIKTKLLNINYLYHIVSILFSLFIGIYLIRFINPIAKINTTQWMFDAVRLSAEFPHDMPQRIAGQDFSSLNLPWWYAPVWFYAQMPLLILIIFSFGTIIVLYRFITFKKIISLAQFSKISPLVVQGIALPLAIIFSGATIYDGVRHLLFVWPFIVVATLFFLTKILILKQSKKLKVFLPLLILALISSNLFATLRWSPYSYAFINPIAGYSSEKRHWDLDYWGVSAREGIERLEKIYSFDEIYVMPDGSSSIPYGGIGLARLEDLGLSNPFGLYVFIRWNHRIVPETCDILFEIKRDRQTLGMGGVCPKGALANTG